MRILLQRVSEARVDVAGEKVGSIGPGLLLFIGLTHGDTREQARKASEKIAALRVFADEQGKMNLSLKELRGEVLVVSQFTLYADTKKGRRPSYVQAAPPEKAEELYLYFIQALEAQGLHVQKGRFGAKMSVSLINEGPVTLFLES
jgi:D-tyrosyl-tRNA(Tyr) deacylase